MKLVGVDFGGAAEARAQRRKIVAIAAESDDGQRFAVRAGGFNGPLADGRSPGRTAEELAAGLLRNLGAGAARHGGALVFHGLTVFRQ